MSQISLRIHHKNAQVVSRVQTETAAPPHEAQAAKRVAMPIFSYQFRSSETGNYEK